MTKFLICSILASDLATALSEVTVESIIKWYGTLCLITLPISLIALLFIYKRRPNIVSKFDKAIDKLVDGKKEPKPEEKAETKDETTAPAPEQRKLSIEDENIESGIPNMILQVGDKYQCYLSEKNRKDVLGGDFTWGTDNLFVGDINEIKGVFEAKKVGKTYIECGGKHIRIYYAEVKPNNTTWFGYRPMNDILTKICLANVKVRELSRHIKNIIPDKNIITYDWITGTLSYQTNKKDETIRIMFRLPDKPEIIEEVKSEITEYMEPLKFKENTGDKFYWFHVCGLDEDYPESVDFTAFLRKSKKGDWYFGVGECWRLGALEDEIRENTEMIERSFKDLMDIEDVPVTVGTKLENETKSPSPEQKNEPTRKAVSRKNHKEENKEEQAAALVKIKSESDKTESQEATSQNIQPSSSNPERPVVQLDDTTDVPDSNSSVEGDDYIDENNIIQVESESQDPFADFSESGEKEYGNNPANDIEHNKQ